MATIIKKAQRVAEVKHYLTFNLLADPSRARSFPCDEHGDLLDQSRVLFANEVEDDPAYGPGVIETFTARHTDPAVLRCVCGARVTLDWDEQVCERCNRLYNLFGQELDAHAAHCYVCGELGGDCNRGGW